MSATFANQGVFERVREERMARTAARIEDLEFLLSVGEHPERALARVGWSSRTAERVLYRNGRADLASRLRVQP